jgi:hypothetical protein
MPKVSKLPRKSGPMISMNPPPSAIKDFAEQAERILRRADKLVTDANAFMKKDKTARKTAKRSR